jgi:hypothetical protein
MVPSIGGGTKRSETLRAVADAVGEGVSVGGEEVSIGDGVGVGDSWASSDAAQNRINPASSIFFVIVAPRSERRTISTVIAPVQIREKIVARLAIGEEFFVHLAGHELVAQLVETDEVIKRAFRRIFACGAGPH